MCTQLEELHLVRCSFHADPLLQLSFPNLTEFAFTPLDSECLSLTPAIEQFLLRHKLTIRKVKLERSKNFNSNTFKQMTALEELDICLPQPEYMQSNNSHINQLNIKKIIVKRCDHENILRFLT